MENYVPYLLWIIRIPSYALQHYNAPARFQDYINDVPAPYFHCFCMAYLDDMLIYSDNFEEYQQHIWLILDAYAMVGLHLKPKKYYFHHHEVKDLGFIISTE
jgi:hypothetical protein